MDIHVKSVDMDRDMDGKFHIHGPAWQKLAGTRLPANKLFGTAQTKK